MPMSRSIALVTFVVREYDEALAFFTEALRFELVEDRQLGDGKRWLVVAPKQSNGASLLLAKAASAPQLASVGCQTGGFKSFFQFYQFIHAFNHIIITACSRVINYFNSV